MIPILKTYPYIKIWDAVEDNVIAFNLMEEHPDLTPEELYQRLEEEYERLTGE